MRRQNIASRGLLWQAHKASSISGSLTSSQSNNTQETTVGFCFGCLTVTLLRKPARQRYFVAPLNLSEVEWAPKIKPLLRPN